MKTFNSYNDLAASSGNAVYKGSFAHCEHTTNEHAIVNVATNNSQAYGGWLTDMLADAETSANELNEVTKKKREVEEKIKKIQKEELHPLLDAESNLEWHLGELGGKVSNIDRKTMKQFDDDDDQDYDRLRKVLQEYIYTD